MPNTELNQRAIMLIEQLSLADLETVINYLSNLKDREVTQRSASSLETAQNPEPKAAGKNPIAQRIIEAVEKSYDVTLEDAETLLQVIKENQQPVQFKSPFEENGHENQ